MNSPSQQDQTIRRPVGRQLKNKSSAQMPRTIQGQPTRWPFFRMQTNLIPHIARVKMGTFERSVFDVIGAWQWGPEDTWDVSITVRRLADSLTCFWEGKSYKVWITQIQRALEWLMGRHILVRQPDPQNAGKFRYAITSPECWQTDADPLWREEEADRWRSQAEAAAAVIDGEDFQLDDDAPDFDPTLDQDADIFDAPNVLLPQDQSSEKPEATVAPEVQAAPTMQCGRPLYFPPVRVVVPEAPTEAPKNNQEETPDNSCTRLDVYSPINKVLVKTDQMNINLPDAPQASRKFEAIDLYVRRGSGKNWQGARLVDALGDFLDETEKRAEAAKKITGDLLADAAEWIAARWDSRWHLGTLRRAMVQSLKTPPSEAIQADRAARNAAQWARTAQATLEEAYDLATLAEGLYGAARPLLAPLLALAERLKGAGDDDAIQDMIQATALEMVRVKQHIGLAI